MIAMRSSPQGHAGFPGPAEFSLTGGKGGLLVLVGILLYRSLHRLFTNDGEGREHAKENALIMRLPYGCFKILCVERFNYKASPLLLG